MLSLLSASESSSAEGEMLGNSYYKDKKGYALLISALVHVHYWDLYLAIISDLWVSNNVSDTTNISQNPHKILKRVYQHAKVCTENLIWIQNKTNIKWDKSANPGMSIPHDIPLARLILNSLVKAEMYIPEVYSPGQRLTFYSWIKQTFEIRCWPGRDEGGNS